MLNLHCKGNRCNTAFQSSLFSLRKQRINTSFNYQRTKTNSITCRKTIILYSNKTKNHLLDMRRCRSRQTRNLSLLEYKSAKLLKKSFSLNPKLVFSSISMNPSRKKTKNFRRRSNISRTKNSAISITWKISIKTSVKIMKTRSNNTRLISLSLRRRSCKQRRKAKTGFKQ